MIFLIISRSLILQKIFLEAVKTTVLNIKYRFINDLALNNLYNALATCDFTNIINYDDCSIAIELLTGIIHDTYNTYYIIDLDRYPLKTSQNYGLLVKF